MTRDRDLSAASTSALSTPPPADSCVKPSSTPTCDYQPTSARKGPTHKTPK